MRGIALAGLLLATQLLHASPAAASSPAGETSAARAFDRSLSQVLRCHALRMLWERARCRTTPPPAGTAPLLDDIVALSFGSGAPATGLLRSSTTQGERMLAPLRCQLAIAAAVRRYVRRSFALQESGVARETAASRSEPSLAAIESRCRVVVRQSRGGVVLPAVGAQCAAAVGAPGSRVDVDALRGCLGRLLGYWIERASAFPEPLRPNIVLIVTDDQRWDSLDTTHSPDGEPVMRAVAEHLAGAGIAFRNAFATTPVCTPSRASILTGQYAFHHGVRWNNPAHGGGAPALDDSSTLATWLHDAGYRTGHYGKYLNYYTALWDPDREAPYVPPGWDDWRVFNSIGNGQYFDYELIENGAVVAYDDYSTDVLADKALDFVEENLEAGEPFFVLFSPSTAHKPYVPAPRHASTFAGLPGWVPPNASRDHPGFADFMLERARQLEMLQAVDEFVDALIETLAAHGAQEDTAIVLVSDNGIAWGEHGTNAKNCQYEECLRIPLIVRYPRLVPLPRETESLVRNIDLAPTLAELAGASPPEGRDGRSLVRALDGTDRSEIGDFLFESYSGFSFSGVRGAEWKYVEVFGSPHELYDLVADPYELDNRLDDPQLADRVEAMRGRLLDLRTGG